MRVVSGIQTTGNLHLGNSLGAIRQWVGFNLGLGVVVIAVALLGPR